MAPKASKSNRKLGRNEAKCKRYRSEQRREKHKIKRVLQSNGAEAARAYAEERGLMGHFRSLSKVG